MAACLTGWLTDRLAHEKADLLVALGLYFPERLIGHTTTRISSKNQPYDPRRGFGAQTKPPGGPQRPETNQKHTMQNPGNHILNVSMGRSGFYTQAHYRDRLAIDDLFFVPGVAPPSFVRIHS